MVINWIPRDFRKDYERRSLPEVRELYSHLREQYYPMTELCETEKDVAGVILKEKIEAVIIGSDAVIQHHPLRERVSFPCRRIIYIGHPTSDRMYPNCFWGSFNNYLYAPIPIAVISGSSQDSKFYYIKGKTKKSMKQSIRSFRYISVRDDWTKKMIDYLTDNEVNPEVTPDPVFAFNHNAPNLVPSKDEIIKRFGIPQDYIILSFKGKRSVNQEWIDKFQEAAAGHGISCVKLPYADYPAYGDIQYSVSDAITPIEWYALIKYSKGYVGNNMHPIVTAITNGIPFFSFDNYGIPNIGGKATNGESSKIYNLLNQADLLTNRQYVLGDDYSPIEPEKVLNSILHFDGKKENLFAETCYQRYENMMEQVYAQITR